MAKKRTTKKILSSKKKKTTSKKSPIKKNKVSKKVSSKKTSLRVGDSAPTFKAPNQDGQTIALSDYQGKNVILYFYPKDMTPGCTQEACDFRDSLNRFKSAGGIVLGVSRDSENLHQRFIEKHDLNFDLLADTDGSICNAYGVIQEKNMYGRKFLGIVRTTFLIDKKGKIAKVYPKVKVQGHVQEVLEDLKNL